MFEPEFESDRVFRDFRSLILTSFFHNVWKIRNFQSSATSKILRKALIIASPNIKETRKRDIMRPSVFWDPQMVRDLGFRQTKRGYYFWAFLTTFEASVFLRQIFISKNRLKPLKTAMTKGSQVKLLQICEKLCKLGKVKFVWIPGSWVPWTLLSHITMQEIRIMGTKVKELGVVGVSDPDLL